MIIRKVNSNFLIEEKRGVSPEIIVEEQQI